VKATSLLFLMISSAALTPGTAYAYPSSPTSQQSGPESAANTVSNHPRDGERAAPADGGQQQDRPHVSVNNHPRGPATITKDRPKQLPNNPRRFPSGFAAKSAFIGNETVSKTVSVRPPKVLGSTVPSLNPSLTNMRHRGASPTVIGGSANSDGKKNGTINGTHMIRRP
jgi:hypothetical protein